MPDTFLPITEAAKRLGVSCFTLRRRIAEGELDAFANPLDRRARLVRTTDLERYAAIRPLAEDRRTAADAAPLTAA